MFVFVLIFAGVVMPAGHLQVVTWRNMLWLGLSGVTTALSWTCYYRALTFGEVSNAALIDKGSVVVALLLPWSLLNEIMTPAKQIGGGLIALCVAVSSRE